MVETLTNTPSRAAPIRRVRGSTLGKIHYLEAGPVQKPARRTRLPASTGIWGDEFRHDRTFRDLEKTIHSLLEVMQAEKARSSESRHETKELVRAAGKVRAKVCTQLAVGFGFGLIGASAIFYRSFVSKEGPLLSSLLVATIFLAATIYCLRIGKEYKDKT